jgi:hypothetical protein
MDAKVALPVACVLTTTYYSCCMIQPLVGACNLLQIPHGGEKANNRARSRSFTFPVNHRPHMTEPGQDAYDMDVWCVPNIYVRNVLKGHVKTNENKRTVTPQRPQQQ